MPQCCLSATEWSVVQLTFAYDPQQRFSSSARPFKHLTPPALHITRFECGKHARTHPPYCITIPIKQKFQTLEAELRTIIDDHQNRLKWGLLTSEQYYRFKGQLDMRMKVGHKNIFFDIFVDLLCKIQQESQSTFMMK
jgi:hypothetical protein